MDPDGVNNLLIWSISEHAQYGETSLINSNSTFATFSHKPDGNFSGIDFVEITVTESADLSASDQLTVIFTVSPEEDAPRFESRPFPGLVVNKPWIYEIRGIDADPSDNLTLQSLLNYPSWLKLIQTDQRTWTFRGNLL